ncbi:MAG: NlpC/P60 family protein [Lachnospiraceae bacterium]
MTKRKKVLAATLTAVLTTANTIPVLASGNDTTLSTDSAVAGIAFNISTYVENANNDKGVADVLNAATNATEEETASKDTKATKETEKAAESETEKDAEDSKDAKEETQKETEKETSPYENIAITQVNNYVNIRKKPNTESKILGKIYDNAAATILKTVDGEDGKWYYIKSGSVKGYMKAEYFVTGEDAEKIAKKVGNVLCKTTATTLRLREKPSTKSTTVDLLAEGSVYSVLKENVKDEDGNKFIKVLVSEGEDGENDVKGYISADYADVYVEFEEAISIEEEKAELERQAELKRQEEEAAAAAAAAEAAEKSSGSSSSGSSSSGSSSSSKSSSSSSKSSSSSSGSGSSSGSSTKSSSGGSGTGAAIAAKAQQYAGWLPYVWGGSSLSSGADCSGFTMSIYAAYGISLPHSSSAQAGGGRSISRSELQPGDLVFYGNGGISHVAIYIGGGQICHEANSRRDCTIDSIGYCGTPVKYVTYTH